MSARPNCRISKVRPKSPAWCHPRNMFFMVREGAGYREAMFTAKYVSKPTDEARHVEARDFEWVRVALP